MTHVVIFTWVAGTTPTQIEDLRSALDSLASDLSDLTTIRHGSDLRIREGNGDYALIAIFSDISDWETYQSDPRHKTFVRDFVSPLQASRLTLQFQSA